MQSPLPRGVDRRSRCDQEVRCPGEGPYHDEVSGRPDCSACPHWQARSLRNRKLPDNCRQGYSLVYIRSAVREVRFCGFSHRRRGACWSHNLSSHRAFRRGRCRAERQVPIRSRPPPVGVSYSAWCSSFLSDTLLSWALVLIVILVLDRLILQRKAGVVFESLKAWVTGESREPARPRKDS